MQPPPPGFWDASPGAPSSSSAPVPSPMAEALATKAPGAFTAPSKQSNGKGSGRRKLKQCLAENCSKGAAPPTPYCIRHGGGKCFNKRPASKGESCRLSSAIVCVCICLRNLKSAKFLRQSNGNKSETTLPMSVA